MHAITDAPTLAAAPLWERTRAMFARAVAATGGAAAIAAIGLLTRTLRRDIIRWLCPLEHIVRKLLLAEAAALARQRMPLHVSVVLAPGRSPSLREEARAAPARSARLDPKQPETWSARFSFALPRDPRAVPESCAPRIRALWGPTPPPPPPPRAARVINRQADALRLARRFEALRRVVEDPLPHARRLANILRRAVRRFPEIVRRCIIAPARTGDYDARDPRLAADAIALAFGAEDKFRDSS